jgi:hypothetical protein
VTTPRQESSCQMQRPAQPLILQHAPKPGDLVRGLKKRVIPVDGCVLSLDDILNLAGRFRRDIPNALNVLGNEHEIPGINMPVLDEAPSLLRAATGVAPVH